MRERLVTLEVDKIKQVDCNFCALHDRAVDCNGNLIAQCTGGNNPRITIAESTSLRTKALIQDHALCNFPIYNLDG